MFITFWLIVTETELSNGVATFVHSNRVFTDKNEANAVFEGMAQDSNQYIEVQEYRGAKHKVIAYK